MIFRSSDWWIKSCLCRIYWQSPLTNIKQVFLLYHWGSLVTLELSMQSILFLAFSGSDQVDNSYRLASVNVGTFESFFCDWWFKLLYFWAIRATLASFFVTFFFLKYIFVWSGGDYLFPLTVIFTLAGVDAWKEVEETRPNFLPTSFSISKLGMSVVYFC